MDEGLVGMKYTAAKARKGKMRRGSKTGQTSGEV